MVKETRETLIATLREAEVKHTPEQIVDIRRTRDGRVIFLENGHSWAGLRHIITRHEEDFVRSGIVREDIAHAVMTAVTEGEIVGMQGNRPVYEVSYKGQQQLIAVTVSNNGYIVGANPASLA